MVEKTVHEERPHTQSVLSRSLKPSTHSHTGRTALCRSSVPNSRTLTASCGATAGVAPSSPATLGCFRGSTVQLHPRGGSIDGRVSQGGVCAGNCGRPVIKTSAWALAEVAMVCELHRAATPAQSQAQTTLRPSQHYQWRWHCVVRSHARHRTLLMAVHVQAIRPDVLAGGSERHPVLRSM